MNKHLHLSVFKSLLCFQLAVTIFGWAAFMYNQTPEAPTQELHSTSAKLLPLRMQQVGYQFQTQLPIPDAMRNELRGKAMAFAEFVNKAEEMAAGEPENDIAFNIVFALHGDAFHELRSVASDYCRRYRMVISDDPCVHVRFCPFDVACDLTVIVTPKCSAERSSAARALVDDTLLQLVATSKRVEDDAVPLPSNRYNLGVKDEQSCEDFARFNKMKV